MPYKDKQTQIEAKRKWRELNRDKQLEMSRRNAKAYRQRQLEKLAQDSGMTVDEYRLANPPQKRGPKKRLTLEESRLRSKQRKKTQIKLTNAENTWFIWHYKKQHPCLCGENHPATLDFHHRDHNTKESDISDLLKCGVSIDKLLKEMQKCDVLCKCCHYKLHWHERTNGEEPRLPERPEGKRMNRLRELLGKTFIWRGKTPGGV